MVKKGGNFFEEHIEKIVLAIVGLVCIWLLVTRVLISPNVVSYDNAKFGCGDIDIYISKQAALLKDKLSRKPKPKPEYDPNVGNFIALVNSAISDIDVSLSLPQPIIASIEVGDNRIYTLPLIGEVNEISVEHIRTVAYVPTEAINEENVYEQAENKPNDIDFVTMGAKFNVAGLCERFYESFAGENVREDWRDPCLANPVFAGVQLQRKELLVDGSWSDWRIVSRTKTDHRKRMFEVIEEVGELPTGGIRVRLLQFDDVEVRAGLLQPEAYRIASAEEEWLPPLLHKRFVKYQQELKAQERLEARAAEREEREQRLEVERGKRRGTESRTRMRPVRGISFDSEDDEESGVSIRRSPRRRGERRGDRERTKELRSGRGRLPRSREVSKATLIDDIYKELDEILIAEKTDLAKIREPLVFWAHDDTVESEKSYRYRIRLGVFNPIAGTNQFSEQDKSQKDKVVLWSKFSDETETVEIPATLYFFPREIQEAAKTVTVQVFRYVLGYWYSKEFAVNRGEVIGKVIDTPTPTVEEEDGVLAPETIDCATGAVLVDVVNVNDWSGEKNLRARQYFDMLYSFDGTDMERVAVKQSYWAKELRVKFNELEKLEKEPKKPLRGWSTRAAKRRRLAPEWEDEDEEYYDEEEYGP